MNNKEIVIKGAREHNLKNIDVTIPRDTLTVFTGLSGSGKSSLAFDTIYAEGRRRYVESLSSYARMFLGQMDKPHVDSIDGLSPAISIDQKTTSKNPRSTVGTVTEIYDYLRLLYARIGVPHCPVCGREITVQTIDQMTDRIMQLREGTKFQIMAPVARGRKGEYTKELEAARKSGFVRARIDGSMYDLSEDIKLDKNKKHNIEIVVDRLVAKQGIEGRLSDSLETALKSAGGTAIVNIIGGEDELFSQNYACPEHGACIDELSPRMFSFNNPFGACPTCTGLGRFLKIDPDLVIPDKTRSLSQGAVKISGWSKTDGGSVAFMYYEGLAKHYGFTLDTPIKDLSKEALNALLYGTGEKRIRFTHNSAYSAGYFNAKFEGIINNAERRYNTTTSDWAKKDLERYMTEYECPDCCGARLKPQTLAVTVGGKNIYELTCMPVQKLLDFLGALRLSKKNAFIGEQILREIKVRLEFLRSVGLDYLTLSRSAATLSGGESQRIRLATQIGSGLTGVLYILDEPSIGLHQRDNDKLIATLKDLRDLGNTLIVVEHDEDTINAADYVVDIGPGAGVNGGNVIFSGTPGGLKKCRESVTGDYLSGRKKVPVPEHRRKGNGKFLEITGAAENNLKNIKVKFPLGEFIAVTGVSGSGKSTLVNTILKNILARDLNRAKSVPGKYKSIKGLEYCDKVIDIDQSPIGRTPRSNPATYTGVFNDIRELFAQTQDAKMRGYGAGRFSFNVKGGRCEACQGDGIIKIEMQFLSDVYVPCDVCKGKRYNRETLEIKYKGRNIHDVLEMTVDEAVEFFSSQPKIARKLATLKEVGLGYVKVGQSATTLSGGEAQRVKLATELSKRGTGQTVYILDEPTTGLHTADVHMLIEVLSKLVDAGNTVIVIEHNLDVVKTADHIIDLGPEGGDRGGNVVAAGTPEQVAEVSGSYTGQYLKKMLR